MTVCLKEAPALLGSCCQNRKEEFLEALQTRHNMKLTTLLLAIVTILVFLFFIFPRLVIAEEESSCLQLGFTESLMCSKCEELKKFVPDDGLYFVIIAYPDLLAALYSDCTKCCAKDDVDSGRTYPYATLKLDSMYRKINVHYSQLYASWTSVLLSKGRSVHCQICKRATWTTREGGFKYRSNIR